MLIKLTDATLRKFREDVAAHRATSNLTDAEYAVNVLHVSLNTLKKCLERSTALSLKPQTYKNIIVNAGLDPKRYGAGGNARPASNEYGGYSKVEFGFIAGQYLLQRRSFLTAENIIRAVLEIEWDTAKGCLTFTERMRYESDAGVAQSFDYSGHVYMHADRMLMTLLSVHDGEARLTMLHTPSRRPGQNLTGPVRTAGVVLTHGFPKRFYQPVVAAVTIEQLPRNRTPSQLLSLCKTLRPGTDEHQKASADLKVAEEHALVMTPLMFRDLKR